MITGDLATTSPPSQPPRTRRERSWAPLKREFRPSASKAREDLQPSDLLSSLLAQPETQVSHSPRIATPVDQPHQAGQGAGDNPYQPVSAAIPTDQAGPRTSDIPYQPVSAAIPVDQASQVSPGSCGIPYQPVSAEPVDQAGQRIDYIPYQSVSVAPVGSADQPASKEPADNAPGWRRDRQTSFGNRKTCAGFLACGALVALAVAAGLAWRTVEKSMELEDELRRQAATVGKGAPSSAGGPWQPNVHQSPGNLEEPIDLGSPLDGMDCEDLSPRATLMVNSPHDWTKVKRYLCCREYGVGCSKQPCEGDSHDCDSSDDHAATDGETTSSPGPTTAATTTTSPPASTSTSQSLHPPGPCDERCTVGAEGDDELVACSASVQWVMQNVYTPGEDLQIAEACPLATTYVGKLCEACRGCSSDLACLPETAHLDKAENGSLVSAPMREPKKADSLFCFALLIAGSSEESLLENQLRGQTSIFECDGHSLYSNVSKTFEAGDARITTKIVNANLQCEYGLVRLRDGTYFNTAFNTPIFIALWEQVIADGKFWDYAWTVKVDVDTVFLPERLRAIVRGDDYTNASKGAGVFLNNCKLGLHGPIEVLSKMALLTWGMFHGYCGGQPPEEDAWLQLCLVSMGVQQVDASDLLAEGSCWRGDWMAVRDWESCATGHAAFHPFKKVDDWEDCHGRARAGETKAVTIKARRMLSPPWADAIFA